MASNFSLVFLVQYAVNSEAEESENERYSGDVSNRSSDISATLTDMTNTSTSLPNTSTPKRPCSSKSELHVIVSALGKTNKLLTNVIERMDKQEKRMENIEEEVDCRSSSTPTRNRHKEVPLQVRVSVLEIRLNDVYLLLHEVVT